MNPIVMNPIVMTSARLLDGALRCALIATVFFCASALLPFLAAETGAEAWLRYAAIDLPTAKAYERFPGAVVLGDSLVLKTAQQELVRGIDQIAGTTMRGGTGWPRENAVVLGTLRQLAGLGPGLASAPGTTRRRLLVEECKYSRS